MSGVRELSFVKTTNGQVEFASLTWSTCHFVSGRAESNRRTLPWEGSIVPLNYARIVVAGAVVIMLLLRYPRQQTVLIIIQAG